MKPALLVLAVSPQTGRPIAYLVAHERLARVPAVDRQTAAMHYGLHVAARQADGSWINSRGVPYAGGTDLDARPYADAAELSC